MFIHCYLPKSFVCCCFFVLGFERTSTNLLTPKTNITNNACTVDAGSLYDYYCACSMHLIQYSSDNLLNHSCLIVDLSRLS